MRCSLGLLVLVGCGRVAFDARPDAGPIGHDEDGDGIGDIDDVCPWSADPLQPDRDGDGVGDRCDPNPDLPIDQIAMFRALTADEETPVLDGTGPWQAGADGDSWQTTGTSFSAMHFDLPFRRGYIEARFDIIAHRVPRRQIGITVASTTSGPYYYGEIFDDDTSTPFTGVSHYNGSTFVMVAHTLLGEGELDGAVTMRFAVDVDQQIVRHDAEVGGMLYVNNGAAPGLSEQPFRLTVQESVVAIRYVAVVVTP